MAGMDDLVARKRRRRWLLKYLPITVLLVLCSAIVFVSQYAPKAQEANGCQAQPVRPDAGVANNHAEDGGCQASDANHSKVWVATLRWPEGVTTWVLILTLLVVGWQSTESRAAAEAAGKASRIALRQTRLQEAAFQQWVILSDWKCELVPDKNELRIGFTVSNPTQYLLVTEQGVLEFSHPRSLHYYIYRRAPLPPNRPASFFVTVEQPSSVTNAFGLGKRIGLKVEGQISFINALGKAVTQDLSGILSCSLVHTELEAAYAKTEYSEVE